MSYWGLPDPCLRLTKIVCLRSEVSTIVDLFLGRGMLICSLTNDLDWKEGLDRLFDPGFLMMLCYQESLSLIFVVSRNERKFCPHRGSKLFGLSVLLFITISSFSLRWESARKFWGTENLLRVIILYPELEPKLVFSYRVCGYGPRCQPHRVHGYVHSETTAKDYFL